jgi:hypothetical protein
MFSYLKKKTEIKYRNVSIVSPPNLVGFFFVPHSFKQFLHEESIVNVPLVKRTKRRK